MVHKMKSRFSKISIAENHGTSKINQTKQHTKLIFIKIRFCYQFCVIIKKLFTLKIFHATKWYIQNEQCNSRRVVRIDKTKSISSWQCKSEDFAKLNHHLFISLKNFLHGKHFNNVDVKTHLVLFLYPKKSGSFINMDLWRYP